MTDLCSLCKKREKCPVYNEMGYYSDVVMDRIDDHNVQVREVCIIVTECDDFEGEQ